MSSQIKSPKKTFEDRPNWACCWPPKNPLSRANFVGVTVLGDQKYWVSVYEKVASNGTRFLKVNINPQEQKETPQTPR